MARYKFRIYAIITSVIFFLIGYFIFGTYTFNRNASVLLFFVLCSSVFPILFIVFFFIGYYKDKPKSNIVKQTPLLIEFIGVTIGCFLGFYYYRIFGSGGYVPSSYPRNILALISTFYFYFGGPVFIITYAIFGFLASRFFYFLFKFRSKKYFIQFIILSIFIVPFSIITFINNQNYHNERNNMKNVLTGMKIEKVTFSDIEVLPNPGFPRSPIRRMSVNVTLYSPIEVKAFISADMGQFSGSSAPEGSVDRIYHIKKGKQQIIFIFDATSCINLSYKKPEDDVAKIREFEIIGSVTPGGVNLPALKIETPPFKITDLTPVCNY